MSSVSYYLYIKSICFFTMKTTICSMSCIENPVKPMDIFNYLSFFILGLKIQTIQNSQNPRFSERYQTEFWTLGFLAFWIFVFLDSWIFGFLDF